MLQEAFTTTTATFCNRYTGQRALTCQRQNPPVKNWRILLVQSFTARMPLLTAASAFGLEGEDAGVLNSVI